MEPSWRSQERLEGIRGQRNAARRELNESQQLLAGHPSADLSLHHIFHLHVRIEVDGLQVDRHRRHTARILDGLVERRAQLVELGDVHAADKRQQSAQRCGCSGH